MSTEFSKPYRVALFSKSNVNPDDHLDVTYNFETYKEATEKYLEIVLSRSNFRTLVEGMDNLVLSYLGEEHGLVRILKTIVIHSI